MIKNLVQKAKAMVFAILRDWLTFKDLKKRVSLEAAQQTKLFERLLDKPFWIWNTDEHKREDLITKGNCCFNHIIWCQTHKGNSDKPKRWIRSHDNSVNLIWNKKEYKTICRYNHIFSYDAIRCNASCYNPKCNTKEDSAY